MHHSGLDLEITCSSRRLDERTRSSSVTQSDLIQTRFQDHCVNCRFVMLRLIASIFQTDRFFNFQFKVIQMRI